MLVEIWWTEQVVLCLFAIKSFLFWSWVVMNTLSTFWECFTLPRGQRFSYNRPCSCVFSVSLFEAAPTNGWMKYQILAASIFLKQTKLHPTHCGRWATWRLSPACVVGTYVSKLLLYKSLQNQDFFSYHKTYSWFFGKLTELHNRLKNFMKTYKKLDQMRFLVALRCFPPSPTYS